MMQESVNAYEVLGLTDGLTATEADINRVTAILSVQRICLKSSDILVHVDHTSFLYHWLHQIRSYWWICLQFGFFTAC
jgi:hypothetical protein